MGCKLVHNHPFSIVVADMVYNIVYQGLIPWVRYLLVAFYPELMHKIFLTCGPIIGHSAKCLV